LRTVVIVILFALAYLTGTLAGASAQTEQRVALVIGNGAYANAPPLRNPANDAKAMAVMLRRVGFDVIERENATRRGMIEALRTFSERLSPGGIGLFFYAGHGIQARGANYLIPTDAVLAAPDDLRYETTDVQDVLSRLDDAWARLSLVILDACRDNPFARSFRSTSQGLAQIDAPRGTVIAFATAPGKLAYEGSGENGLYTTELLKAMSIPGLKLQDIFERVTDAVARKTAGAQTPWISSSFRGDFYFIGPTTKDVAQQEKPAVVGPDQAAWAAVANSTTAAPFEAFLAQFPNSVFANIARAKISELSAPKPAVVARPVHPPASGSSIPAAGSSIKDFNATFIALRAAKVHSEPSATSNDLGTLPAETMVGVTGRVGKDWLRVAWSGEVGFVSAPLLQEIDTAEVAAWSKIKETNSPDEIEAFLLSYPNGFYSERAIKLMAALKPPKRPGDSSREARQRAEEALARKDYAEAMRWYREAADQGDPDAQTQMGVFYHNGLGVPRDYAEAMRWYRKAADQGFALAQRNIAILYRYGYGVAQDYAEAMRWNKKAAAQGDALAQNEIGVLYWNGWGVPKDNAEAVHWYSMAANQGYATAQNNIGYLYLHGLGLRQDYTEAMRWFRKAAEQGDAYAQYSIGMIHHNGLGVPRDYAEAMRWYREAADQGFAKAQKNIGILYESGLGVPANLVEARAWMKRAADNGDQWAKIWLATH
jgi:TPR repeat protein